MSMANEKDFSLWLISAEAVPPKSAKLTETCPVLPKWDRRGPCLPAGRKGTIGTRLPLLASWSPLHAREALRQAQSREICRTAPPCLPRPNGVNTGSFTFAKFMLFGDDPGGQNGFDYDCTRVCRLLNPLNVQIPRRTTSTLIHGA